MKIFISFCLVIFLNIFTYCTLADSSNCTPGRGATLLNRRHVYRPAIKGVAQDVYVPYPKDGEPAANIKIVDFCVTDHDPNLFGAKPVYAYSVDEDVGRGINKATIILRGLESRGINSTVEFYGFNNTRTSA